MAYRKLYFPIPTPTQLGAILAMSDARTSAAQETLLSETNPSYINMGGGEWLNIYTGEIVDTETMDNISSIAQSNPSILTAPVRSLPHTLQSSAIFHAVQSNTVQTAADVGIGPGAGSPTGIMAWFQNSSSIFGHLIPNWALAAGGGAIAFGFLGGGKKRRRK